MGLLSPRFAACLPSLVPYQINSPESAGRKCLSWYSVCFDFQKLETILYLIIMDFLCNHLPAPPPTAPLPAKYTLHHSVLISALIEDFIAFYCKLLVSFSKKKRNRWWLFLGQSIIWLKNSLELWLQFITDLKVKGKPRTQWTPDPMLCPLKSFISCDPHRALQKIRICYYPHFVDKETDASGGEMSCLRSAAGQGVGSPSSPSLPFPTRCPVVCPSQTGVSGTEQTSLSD